MENNDLLSRVALRIGDQQFKDFDKSIYLDALKKANRTIAKKYGIPNKVISFKTGDMIEDVTDSIYLSIDDFKAEYHVSVNGKVVYKRKLEKEYNSYRLDLLQDRYVFDYSYYQDLENQYVKSLEDEVVIYYTSLPEYDSDMSDYFIPQKFIEEQIEETAKTICQYGLAKFIDPIVVAKYTRVYQMLQNNNTYDKQVVENKEWIKMKAWSPI